MGWGTPVEIERKRRIKVAACAYAYEVMSESLISDHEYDAESRLIDVSVDTGNPVLDRFFREEFLPDTGMWVHDHPDQAGLRKVVSIMKGEGERKPPPPRHQPQLELNL